MSTSSGPKRTIFKGKTAVERVLTAMSPAGAHRLGVSKWNMLSMGRIFFEARMRRRHVENLQNLMALARGWYRDEKLA